MYNVLMSEDTNCLLRVISIKFKDSRGALGNIPKFLRDNVTGRLVEMAGIHKAWQKHIDENKLSLIIAPRDHGKSEQIAIGRILCEIGKNTDIRIKLFSGKNDLARKRVFAIKRYMEDSSEYREAYPNVKICSTNSKSASEALTVERRILSKEPTLESYGIMSAATGDRADLIVCDDVCTFENTLGKSGYRAIVKEKFYNDIMNMLEPDGRLIYICTLWHIDDLSHELMRNRDNNGFALLFQAIPADLTPLWIEKWPREALIKRRSANHRAFDRGFRNIPMSDEDALFPRDLISGCIHPGNPHEHVTDKFRRYIGVDLAISRSDASDYTVIFIIAVDPESGVKIPLEIIRRKMTSPETARTLIDAGKRHQPHLIYVEINAYQDSLIQWIRESGNIALPIEGFLTGKQKFDEFIGLPSMSVEFANKGWAIYNHQNPLAEGSESCSCAFCTFIDELVNFPIAKHDDTIMAAWFAREAARKDQRGGFEIW